MADGGDEGRERAKAGPAPLDEGVQSLFAFNTQQYSNLLAKLDGERPGARARGGTLTDGRVSAARTFTVLPTIANLSDMSSPETSSVLDGPTPAPQLSGGDSSGGGRRPGAFGTIGNGTYKPSGVPASFSLNYLLQGSDLPLSLGGDGGVGIYRDRPTLPSEFHSLPSWHDHHGRRDRRRSPSSSLAEDDDGEPLRLPGSASGSPGLSAQSGEPPSVAELRIGSSRDSHAQHAAKQQHHARRSQQGHGRADGHGHGGGSDSGGVRRDGGVGGRRSTGGGADGEDVPAAHHHAYALQQQQQQMAGAMHSAMMPMAMSCVPGAMAGQMGMGMGMQPVHMGAMGAHGMVPQHMGGPMMPMPGMQPGMPGMLPPGAHGLHPMYAAGQQMYAGAPYGAAQPYGMPAYAQQHWAPPAAQYGAGGHYASPQGGGDGMGGMHAMHAAQHQMGAPGAGQMLSPGMMMGGAGGGHMGMGGMGGMGGSVYMPSQMAQQPQGAGWMPGRGGGGMAGAQQRHHGGDGGAATGRAVAGGGGGGGGRHSRGDGGGDGGGARGAERADRAERLAAAEPRERAPKRLLVGGQEVFTLEEVCALGGVCELALDQHGCRFLQEQLEHAPQKALGLMLELLLPDFERLMVDPFGNYLCQKVAQYSGPEQQLEIITRIAPALADISLNVHGTRSVQRLLESLREPRAHEVIANALRPRVDELVKDQNANHVIQRCVATLGEEHTHFVVDAVRRAFVEVGTHRHGCCVLQRCLDNATGQRRDNLITDVVEHTAELIADPYGNYVVQYVLQLKAPALTRKVAAAIRGSIAELATQKFSSNVIEKCLTSGDEEAVSMVITELLEADSLSSLLHDPFGNYVVQRILQVGSDAELKLLLERVGPHMGGLRDTLYGKRIQAKLLKRFPQLAVAVERS